MNAFVILPDQLFDDKFSLEIIEQCDEIYIIEDPFYFSAYTYHRSKIILHRASMRSYYKMLKRKYGQKKKSGYELDKLIENTHGNFLGGAKKNPYIRYVPFDKIPSGSSFLDYLSGIKMQVNMFEPASVHAWGDKLFNAKFEGLTIKFYDSPNFFVADPKKYFKKGKRHKLDAFYKKMRKEYTPKLNPGGKPIGGKWIYDSENQESAKDMIKHKIKEPEGVNLSLDDPEFKKAIEYSRKFKTIGEIARYPINSTEAKYYLNNFLKKKLKHFGKYQDAILVQKKYTSNLFHSILSSSLNIGLLYPTEVIDEVIKYWSKRKKSISIASVEGFVRQILGWREYVHAMYVVNPQYPNLNLFNSKRTLSDALYKGETGYLPVDIVVKKFLATGYAHHIERLMIMNSFMLMQEIHPALVVRWFMEMQIDSAEWCMWSNCSGFAYQDDGLIASRPYFSTSNYWLKMSNLDDKDPVVKESAEKWDTLYYSFINNNKTKLRKLYFVSGWVAAWDKKSASEKKQILEKFAKNKIYV